MARDEYGTDDREDEMRPFTPFHEYTGEHRCDHERNGEKAERIDRVMADREIRMEQRYDSAGVSRRAMEPEESEFRKSGYEGDGK